MASSFFDALSFGAGIASLYRGEQLHRQTLEHDKELHVRGIASSTEQHFQELCAELLTAAKEADRDVWEQRNGQFNNLMLSSTLMFGVAVASIVEGNFNQTVDGHATAWFACFVACALSFLFVSLVCCMLVSRRMSIYMIMRSSRFVSRLGNIIKTADKIYTDAADAADRIHTGADFVSNRGAKGPVAKIDVREELLRMRCNRNQFQKELMRGLESTTGGMRAVELQAASPGSPRGDKSSPFEDGAAGVAGGSMSDGGYSLCGAEPAEEGCAPRRTPLLPIRKWASSGGAAGRGRTAEAGGGAQGGAHGGAHGGGAPRGLPPKPPEIQLPRQWCQGEGSSAEANPNHADANASRRPSCEASTPTRESSQAARRGAARELASLNGVKSFDDFWERHCAKLGQVAFGAFITGTSCVWGAMMTFMWDTYHDSTMAVAIFIGICTVSLTVTLAITCIVLAGDQRIVDQDLRDEAKQHGGHANSKHQFSALHLARERSYQRFNLHGAERPGRSPML